MALNPSPFLTDLLSRAYDTEVQSAFLDQNAPGVQPRLLGMISAWLDSPEPALADLLRRAKGLGIRLEEIPSLLYSAAILIGRTSRKKAVNLLRFAGLNPPVDYYEARRTDGRTFADESRPNRIVECIDGDDIDLAVDIGCGNGRDAIGLALRASRVIGVDQSETAVRLARERIAASKNGFAEKILIKRGDLSSLLEDQPQLRGRVNVLTATSVFHLSPRAHLQRALRGVSEALAPNGRIGIQQKTPDCFINDYDRGDDASLVLERWPGEGVSRLCDDGYSRWFLNEPALARELRAAGFTPQLLRTETVCYVRDIPDKFVLAIARLRN